MSSIYDNTFFFGLRYFDDVRLISVAYQSSQMRRSETVIEKYISGLPSSLVLEPEFCDKGFLFLECAIVLNLPNFMIVYLSKNYIPFKVNGKPKFYALQNFNSYQADGILIAKNNLRSKFTAMTKYCNSNQAIFSSVLSWFQDFLIAEYPAKILISVLKEFFFSSKNGVWKALIDEVKSDYSFRIDIFKLCPLARK